MKRAKLEGKMKRQGWRIKEGVPLVVAGYHLTFNREVHVSIKPPENMPEPWLRVLDRGGFEVMAEQKLTKPV